MDLHWHIPTQPMHGDMVELVAPYGRYLLEFGQTHKGTYYVACCDHSQEVWAPQWYHEFPTAQAAKAYAQRYADMG